jgi:hypothetical protein
MTLVEAPKFEPTSIRGYPVPASVEDMEEALTNIELIKK